MLNQILLFLRQCVIKQGLIEVQKAHHEITVNPNFLFQRFKQITQKKINREDFKKQLLSQIEQGYLEQQGKDIKFTLRGWKKIQELYK